METITLQELIDFYRELTRYETFDYVARAKEDYEAMHSPEMRISWYKTPQGFVMWQEQGICHYINALYVRPEYRGHGYATWLMSMVPADIQTLTVYKDNPALAIYLHYGFKISGGGDLYWHMYRGAVL